MISLSCSCLDVQPTWLGGNPVRIGGSFTGTPLFRRDLKYPISLHPSLWVGEIVLWSCPDSELQGSSWVLELLLSETRQNNKTSPVRSGSVRACGTAADGSRSGPCILNRLATQELYLSLSLSNPKRAVQGRKQSQSAQHTKGKQASKDARTHEGRQAGKQASKTGKQASKRDC